MGFSSEWETVYKENEQLSVWPWSHLVSLAHRYGNLHEGMRVLEIGCGAGANIPFFISVGADYYGVEGSGTMVKRLNEKWGGTSVRIAEGDFTKTFVWDGKFDLIVDRGAITHNATDDISRVLSMVKTSLTDEGCFISMDWFSVRNKAYSQTDAEDIDEYSRKNFASGYFKGLGTVHFADKNHLLDIFCDFKIEYLAEKVNHNYFPEEEISASWDVVARLK